MGQLFNLTKNLDYIKIKNKLRRKTMDFTVEARKLLNELWEKAWLRGRCWGIKKVVKNNPYGGTNTTIAIGDELVSVSLGKDGKLIIHEFVKTQNTKLGNEVKKILKQGNLNLK